MSRFKVGDWVRCVSQAAPYGLQPRGVYRVSSISISRQGWIGLDGHYPVEFGEVCFELVESAGTPTPTRDMHCEETRVTSDTGAETGVKLARYDQIPTWPLYLLACKYGKGNDKYPQANGIDNWRNGFEYSKAYAKLQRHANQFWSGEDVDPDSGELHLVAVIWHAMALIEWGSRPELAAKFDDRQDKINPMEER